MDPNRKITRSMTQKKLAEEAAAANAEQALKEEEKEKSTQSVNDQDQGKENAEAKADNQKVKEKSVPKEEPCVELKPIAQASQTEKRFYPFVPIVPPSKRYCNPTTFLDQSDLLVSVIDANQPNGHISLSQWRTVETMLLDAMVQIMAFHGMKPVRYEDVGWQDGLKLIYCCDVYSLKWLSGTVLRFPAPWPNARLAIGSRHFGKPLITVKLMLPLPMCKEPAMNLLRWQNPGVVTGDWMLVSMDPGVAGQKMVFKVTQAAVDKIVARRGILSWGMGTVDVNVKNEDIKPKIVEMKTDEPDHSAENIDFAISTAICAVKPKIEKVEKIEPADDITG